MRRAIVVITILVLVLLSVAAGLRGIRPVSRPLEANPIIVTEEEPNLEAGSTDARLAEAVATLEILQNTATAAVVEKRLTETIGTLEVMQATATAIASVPTATPTTANASTHSSSSSPLVGSMSPPPTSAPTLTARSDGSPALASTSAAMPEPAGVRLIVPASARASSEPACSQDSRRNRVWYPAGNVIDGQLDTAWRESPGLSPWILVELPQTTIVTQIAIVGGYAKIDPYDGSDRWRQNHRPRRVKVYLNEVEQGVYELSDIRDWQKIDIQPRPADRVGLLVVDTYPPLEGNRPYVAISEIRLVGRQP